MTEFVDKNFTRIYLIVCFLVFIVVCLRAFFIPFAHDEASTFFFYVQNSNYLPYRAHVYTNNHVLNSALANICYLIAGSHRFVLRIPNVLAFLVLCFGVFRFFRYFKTLAAKCILVTFLLLTFNFLDFFELCRGYGLSMAFLVLGLSCLQDYFAKKEWRSLLLFSICLQLALSANLILIVLAVILLFFILVFQLREKLLAEGKNLVLLALNLLILLFWIKFSFFYKSKGMLDSGWGEDYWIVSFQSLIQFIFGTTAPWIQILAISLFSVSLLYGIFRFVQSPNLLRAVYEPRFFYLIVLSLLILAFYLQKKLLDVNYPEDRTGLFFYIFFALSTSFFFEGLPRAVSLSFGLPFLAASLAYFALSFNFSSFTHYFYHVMPKEIYTRLENEHKKKQQLFTIGGHPNREMNYTFLNYRAHSFLNPMDDNRQMHMNCDYYYALMAEKPFYRFFYDEIAYDQRWDRVLLKRKQPIHRKAIESLVAGPKRCTSGEEFFEFLKVNDSAFATRSCLEADIELTFKQVPTPFHAFVVMHVVDTGGKMLYYKKVPLNWIADDLNGMTKRFKLTTGPLPQKFRELVVYVWNIDKKPCDFEMNQLRIFELQAPGINVVIPKNYYPYVKRLLKQELL